MEHGATIDVARLNTAWGCRRETVWSGANGAVSRNERSEELGISVGYRSVDGVDRRESRWACWTSRGAIVSAEQSVRFFKIPGICYAALPLQQSLSSGYLWSTSPAN